MPYSTSNICVTLKSGLGVVQGHWNWRRLCDFLLVGHCNNSSILYHFRVFWRWTISTISTLKSGLEVIQCHWNWCHSKAWVWFPVRLL